MTTERSMRAGGTPRWGGTIAENCSIAPGHGEGRRADKKKTAGSRVTAPRTRRRLDTVLTSRYFIARSAPPHCTPPSDDVASSRSKHATASGMDPEVLRPPRRCRQSVPKSCHRGSSGAACWSTNIAPRTARLTEMLLARSRLALLGGPPLTTHCGPDDGRPAPSGLAWRREVRRSSAVHPPLTI